MGPCRRRGSAAGLAGALGCIARSGCPVWVRGSWVALPWISREPWRNLWFLNGRVCQKPQSEAAGEVRGARLCPLPGGGSSSPHQPLAARARGGIHGPTCPREVRTASKSVPPFPAPIFFLPAPGIPCHPEQGGDARAGTEQEMGPEHRVLSSAFPVGPLSKPVCLPLAPECAPVLGGVFPRWADAAGKPSRRRSYSPVVPDDAPCRNMGEGRGEAME